MMIKTSELIGDQLDWAVATCEGYTSLRKNPHRFDSTLIMSPPRNEYGPVFLDDLDYSGDWSMGGPIIDREHIDLVWHASGELEWSAYGDIGAADDNVQRDPHPLIAAMRCYCCAKLGDEVDIPEELL